MQGFPEIDGAVLGTPSHGASGTSTQLGAAHTQARQSCSQHSGRLSVVWGWGWGGGGRREWQSCSPHCTGRMGDVYEGEGQSCNQHTLHKNSDTLHSEILSLSLSLSQ